MDKDFPIVSCPIDHAQTQTVLAVWDQRGIPGFQQSINDLSLMYRPDQRPLVHRVWFWAKVHFVLPELRVHCRAHYGNDAPHDRVLCRRRNIRWLRL